MKLSLSTNWFPHASTDGEAAAEKAAELGFDELELGYAASEKFIEGVRRRHDLIPVASVHAFCPAPISAPSAHPELYRLADFERENAQLAKTHVIRCVEFAAEIGAETLVLHAGRVSFRGWFDRLDSQKLGDILRKCASNRLSRRYLKALSVANIRRCRRGKKLFESFRSTLDELIAVLEKNNVTLALENMPYLEGFPDENEMNALIAEFSGAPIKAWFDTGHHLVRINHGWTRGVCPFRPESVAGMHLNDVESLNDDHLAPSEGAVDFSSLGNLARRVRHVVFEPSSSVTEQSLQNGIDFIRKTWDVKPCR